LGRPHGGLLQERSMQSAEYFFGQKPADARRAGEFFDAGLLYALQAAKMVE